MRKTAFTLLALIILTTDSICQKSTARYFGDPILTDSLSTLFIPTRYNEEFLSTNKIAFWGDYYANIIAYNFKSDTYKKLFDQDTFIESLRGVSYGPRTNERIKNLTSKWVFLLVKNKDTNGSGRIDERDPSILFAASGDGQLLKQVTAETENVVWYDFYDKQGFMLLKIQKDSDKDGAFRNDDREFYFKKVNLNDLSLGKGIDL